MPSCAVPTSNPHVYSTILHLYQSLGCSHPHHRSCCESCVAATRIDHNDKHTVGHPLCSRYFISRLDFYRSPSHYSLAGRRSQDSVLVFSIHLISFREAQWTDSRWLSTPYVMVYLFIAFQLFSIVDSWWGGDMPEGCNEVRE